MGGSGDLTGVDEAWAHLQLVMGKLNLELGALAVGRST